MIIVDDLANVQGMYHGEQKAQAEREQRSQQMKRAWVDAHSEGMREAPEGVECLVSFADPIISRPLISALVVKAGDVEVSLC